MMADESSVVRVWLEPWQWGCCGDEFGVGDTVSWRLGPAGDRYDDQFALGLDPALAPDYFEDHHIDLPEDAPLTTGVVRASAGCSARTVRSAASARTNTRP